MDDGRERTGAAAGAVGAGAAAAGGLAAVGALHACWALGGSWPGSDQRELAEIVVGPEGTRFPPPSAVWAVTALLEAAAVILLARVGVAGRWLPGWIVRTGAVTVAAVLLLRGVVGAATSLAAGLPSTYHRLDVALYSPLCVALGLGALAAARAGPAHGLERVPHLPHGR